MGVMENLKEIGDLIRKYNDSKLDQKIGELEREIVELTVQIGSLEEENEELKRTLSLIKKMGFKKPFYYQEGDPVPFCPRCWEKEKRPVHLLGPIKVGTGLRYGCPSCKEFFMGDTGMSSPNS
jgi:hypothetical protein